MTILSVRVTPSVSLDIDLDALPEKIYREALIRGLRQLAKMKTLEIALAIEKATTKTTKTARKVEPIKR